MATETKATPATKPLPPAESFAPKVLKQVTVPFIVPPENHDPIYIKFLTPFIEGKDLNISRKRRGSDGQNMKPPSIAEVINLQTRSKAKLIGNQVVMSTLEESYAKQTYVGKCFLLRRLDKIKSASGNQYFAFEIFEIEEPFSKK